MNINCIHLWIFMIIVSLNARTTVFTLGDKFPYIWRQASSCLKITVLKQILHEGGVYRIQKISKFFSVMFQEAKTKMMGLLLLESILLEKLFPLEWMRIFYLTLSWESCTTAGIYVEIAKSKLAANLLQAHCTCWCQNIAKTQRISKQELSASFSRAAL